MVAETRSFAERIHRAAVNRLNTGLLDAIDWQLYSLWKIPEDDSIVSILIDTLKNPYTWDPADESLVFTSLDYEWEYVIAEMLSRAIGSNKRRIQMLRTRLRDPTVRRVATMALHFVAGEERAALIDDLESCVAEMDEEEIDHLIEERIQRTPDPLLRIMNILRSAPHYQPFPYYLCGKLPVHKERLEKRVPNPTVARSDG